MGATATIALFGLTKLDRNAVNINQQVNILNLPEIRGWWVFTVHGNVVTAQFTEMCKNENKSI